MNCETFQTILPDLGRDYPLDLRTRQDGLAHAERCPKCSARLKDECRLVTGLGTLAESFATAEASPKIEEALLKAFQTRTIKQQAEKRGETPRVMRALPSRPSANDSPLPPRRNAWCGQRALPRLLEWLAGPCGCNISAGDGFGCLVLLANHRPQARGGRGSTKAVVTRRNLSSTAIRGLAHSNGNCP